jgi:hypothetical protein
LKDEFPSGKIEKCAFIDFVRIMLECTKDEVVQQAQPFGGKLSRFPIEILDAHEFERKA